jgi:nickel-dependent lactate racemase
MKGFNMNITIPYGNDKKSFTVPDEYFCEVLSPYKVNPKINTEEILNMALDNPIGSKRIEEIVKGAKTVSIICDDMSQNTSQTEYK